MITPVPAVRFRISMDINGILVRYIYIYTYVYILGYN